MSPKPHLRKYGPVWICCVKTDWRIGTGKDIWAAFDRWQYATSVLQYKNIR